MSTAESVPTSEAAAEVQAQVKHETTIFAEPIAHWGPVTITNSLLTSWLAVAIIIVLAIAMGRKFKQVPGKMQSAVETIIDAGLNLADSITGNRKITEQVFPLVFSIFIFIIINNWLGLIPGVGSIGWIERTGTENIFVPLFRGATADVNTTLALSLFSVIAANVFGIIIVGGWKYLNKFINVRTLIAIPSDFRHNKAAVIVNPIQFFVGLIEIVGEIAKVASLSFRLFGNIFAGEVLLTAMAALFAFVLPIPFMFLEILVGLIQALIFAVLTLVYFTIASQDHSAESH